MPRPLMQRDTLNRIQSVQVLRAVAALAVVVTHLGAEFNSSGAPGAFPHFGLGAAGVDLFFVISGFVMVISSDALFGARRAAVQFISGRLIRIVPLYWLATVVFLVFVLFGQNKTLGEAGITPAGIAASFAFIPWPRTDGNIQPVLGLGWTLNYEMFFYAVFAATIFARRGLAVLLASAIFVAFMVWRPAQLPLSAWGDGLAIEFIFGMLIALAYRNGVRIAPLVSAAMIAVAVSLYIASDSMPDVPRYWSLGIPSAILLAGCVLSNKKTSEAAGWRFMAFLGECSYALYLFHLMAFSIPRRTVPWLIESGFPERMPLPFAAMITASAILFAIGIHIFLERPLTLWLRRVFGFSERTTSGGAGTAPLDTGRAAPSLPQS